MCKKLALSAAGGVAGTARQASGHSSGRLLRRQEMVACRLPETLAPGLSAATAQWDVRLHVVRRPLAEIRNPKHEIRNKSKARSQSQNGRVALPCHPELSYSEGSLVGRARDERSFAALRMRRWR